MAKSKKDNGKKKGGIVKLKIVVERLQRSLLLGTKLSSPTSSWNLGELEEIGDASYVPDDVKEGHFAVMVTEDEELKRFVIPLSYLTQPSFLRLLEQAAEVYGFDHEGALTLPCRASELEQILAEQQSKERSSRVVRGGFAQKWSSRKMVKSC